MCLGLKIIILVAYSISCIVDIKNNLVIYLYLVPFEVIDCMDYLVNFKQLRTNLNCISTGWMMTFTNAGMHTQNGQNGQMDKGPTGGHWPCL